MTQRKVVLRAMRAQSAASREASVDTQNRPVMDT